jgi:hypothetical protein
VQQCAADAQLVDARTPGAHVQRHDVDHKATDSLHCIDSERPFTLALFVAAAVAAVAMRVRDVRTLAAAQQAAAAARDATVAAGAHSRGRGGAGALRGDSRGAVREALRCCHGSAGAGGGGAPGVGRIGAEKPACAPRMRMRGGGAQGVRLCEGGCERAAAAAAAEAVA